MFLLRLVGILVAITAGASIVLFLLTGNRKALRFALQVFKWAVVFALIVFALLILERFVVPD